MSSQTEKSAKNNEIYPRVLSYTKSASDPPNSQCPTCLRIPIKPVPCFHCDLSYCKHHLGERLLKNLKCVKCNNKLEREDYKRANLGLFQEGNSASLEGESGRTWNSGSYGGTDDLNRERIERGENRTERVNLRDSMKYLDNRLGKYKRYLERTRGRRGNQMSIIESQFLKEQEEELEEMEEIGEEDGDYDNNQKEPLHDGSIYNKKISYPPSVLPENTCIPDSSLKSSLERSRRSFSDDYVNSSKNELGESLSEDSSFLSSTKSRSLGGSSLDDYDMRTVGFCGTIKILLIALIVAIIGICIFISVFEKKGGDPIPDHIKVIINKLRGDCFPEEEPISPPKLSYPHSIFYDLFPSNLQCLPPKTQKFFLQSYLYNYLPTPILQCPLPPPTPEEPSTSEQPKEPKESEETKEPQIPSTSEIAEIAEIAEELPTTVEKVTLPQRSPINNRNNSPCGWNWATEFTCSVANIGIYYA